MRLAPRLGQRDLALALAEAGLLRGARLARAVVTGDPCLVFGARAILGQDRAAAGMAEHMGPSRSPCPTDTRPSKTKQAPCHRLSASGTSSRYFRIPPARWYTSSTPSFSRKWVDFSQRMPPVQNIATRLL